MGKHVNHQDAQDSAIFRNSKMLRQSGSFQERDPATLTIPEQEKILADKLKAKRIAKDAEPVPVKVVRITHYK